MTTLSTTEARDLIDTGLADEALTRVITREESWLSAPAGGNAGPLDGPRTENFWVQLWNADSPLLLHRPTDEVTVQDANIPLAPNDVRLLSQGTVIERVLGYWMGTTNRPLGPVQVTYTPNDVDLVKGVTIDLVRLSLAKSGFNSEQIGQYRYDAPSTQEMEAARRRIARQLLPHRGAKTMGLRSSIQPDRIGYRVWSEWDFYL